jgi:CRP/FNR family transcriptional regulator
MADPVARDVALATERNKVWYLQQNRLFSNTIDGSLEANAHLFTIVTYPRKTAIFDQGDPTRLIYFLKRGTVRLARLTEDGREVTVAILGPGDLFGEETLFEPGPRSTVAIALDDVLVCMVRADDLFAMISADPALALGVARILSARVGALETTMEDLAYAKVGERLMHLFRRLADEHGAREARGTRLAIRLTHADLASLVGSTRETVSAEIATLARSGRIIADGRTIILPDTEGHPA